VKVAVGTTVTNRRYPILLNPNSVGESYTAIAGVMSRGCPGCAGQRLDGRGHQPDRDSGVLCESRRFDFGADGSFNYTPATNFSGVDSFAYKANDGVSDGNVATVTLVVTPTPSVLFSDDFTRGTDPGPLPPWSVQSGNWTITGGEFQAGSNSLHGYANAYVSDTWSNYAVQASLRFPVGAFAAAWGAA